MILTKIKQKGLVRTLKAVLRLIKGPISRLFNHRTLKKNEFVASFVHEGDVKIMLPKVSAWRAFLGMNSTFTKSAEYFHRPNAEVLLRKTIYSLYRQGYIDSNKSVIDIGCWIADNSLVWAKMLTDNAFVFAIDPSTKNQNFGKRLAELNGIKNVKWVEAVCSDSQGVELAFDGKIDHASFKENETSGSFLVSTTLDRIVEQGNDASIGLLHVDVEGFELNVLKGARSIIEKNRPVITFEQHISKENVALVVDFLKSFGYRIFMINEVLSGCDLDCRNFIAIDASKEYPVIEEFDHKTGRDLGIFSATVGPVWIEFDDANLHM